MPQDTFQELREALDSLTFGNEYRPSVAIILKHILDQTVAELERREADFHTLCREVASLSIDHFSKQYATSPEFDRMLDRRGVVLPEISR